MTTGKDPLAVDRVSREINEGFTVPSGKAIALSAGAALSEGSILVGTTAGVQTSFATLALAKAAAVSGNLIFVAPGNYAVTANLLAAGVNWHARPGATFSVAGATVTPFFTDGGAAMTAQIFGDTFNAQTTSSAGVIDATGLAVVVSNASSALTLDINYGIADNSYAAAHTGSFARISAGTLNLSAHRIDGSDGVVSWADGKAFCDVDWGRGGLWLHPAPAATGEFFYRGHKLEPYNGPENKTVIADLTGTSSKAFIAVERITAGIPITVGGGNTYFRGMRVENTSTTYGDAVAFHTGGYAVISTLCTAGTAITSSSAGGVLHFATLDWDDNLGSTDGMILHLGNNITHVHGGYFKAVTSNGVQLDDGTLHLRGTSIDTSAVAGSNAVSMSGGSLVCHSNPTFTVPSGRESIAGTGSVTGHFVANTAVASTITPLHGYTLAISGKTAVEIPALGTVANLPTASAALKGARSMCSDLSALPAFGGTLTGGGSVCGPVYCDGSAWRAG